MTDHQKFEEDNDFQKNQEPIDEIDIKVDLDLNSNNKPEDKDSHDGSQEMQIDGPEGNYEFKSKVNYPKFTNEDEGTSPGKENYQYQNELSKQSSSKNDESGNIDDIGDVKIVINPEIKEKKKKSVVTKEPSNNKAMEIKQVMHCFQLFWHLIFKVLAILAFIYFEGGTEFVIVVLLTSFDFWVVKNITGRFLVGLHWGSNFDNEGAEIWYYKSMDASKKANDLDKGVFWIAQTGITIFWFWMFFMFLLSLSLFNACLSMVALILQGVQLYGYYKCSKEHQKKVKEWMLKFGLKML